MPPPTSGGVVMIEMLNILENFDLPKLGRALAQALHYEIEAMRRGYLDRARFLGDPDFVKMPLDRADVEGVREDARRVDRSESRVEQRRARQGHPDADRVGDRSRRDDALLDRRQERQRRVNTYTLEGGFGSHVVVSGAGFILNNEMGDFNKKPGETNARGDIGTPANVIAPGKRMLSSMSPTIVTKNGTLFMVTGSPGGRTIINTVMEIVLNAIDFGMDAREAVATPRFHHQWMPDSITFERNALPDSTTQRLQAMGHARQVRQQRRATDTRSSSRTALPSGANDRRSVGLEGRRSVRPSLELPLLHLLEQLERLGVLLGRGPARHVERRIVGATLGYLRLRRLGDRFLHELGELLFVHCLDSWGERSPVVRYCSSPHPNRPRAPTTLFGCSEIRAIPRLTTRSFPNRDAKIATDPIPTIGRCSARLSASTNVRVRCEALQFHRTRWRAFRPADVFLGGNRGESGATWRDRDDKGKDPDHP